MHQDVGRGIAGKLATSAENVPLELRCAKSLAFECEEGEFVGHVERAQLAGELQAVDNGIGIAGIEFITDESGDLYT